MARTSRKGQAARTERITETIGEVYRTGIYLRLSLEDNGKKDSDSIENQRELLMEYISGRPELSLTDIYMDNGYTGTDFSRPEFNRMLDDARKGRINCILVKDLSRLGRNYVEAGDYLEKVFPFLKVRFIAVNDHYDSETLSAGDQLGASLKNIVNDMYAKDISRKVGSALKAKRLRGDYIGNYAPYGYLKDPENPSRLIVDREAAPIVRKIFEMRAAGAGITAIARALNEKDYPSPGRLRYERGILTNNNQKGKDLPWNRHVLRDLLWNVVYIGNLAQGRSSQCLHRNVPFHYIEESEWDVANGTHEPIIEMELWEKAQEVNKTRYKAAKENAGKYAALPKRENPYGQILRCADCGRVLKYTRSYAKGGTRAYYNYKCPNNIELGDKACPKKNIRADDLDHIVLETLHKQMDVFMDARKVLKKLIALEKKQTKKNAPENRIQSIREELEKQRNRSTALYTDYKEGLLTQEEYLYAKQKYQEKIVALEGELSKISQPRTKTDEIGSEEKQWEKMIEQYRNASEISREMVAAMVKGIQVHTDNQISVEFRYMNEFEELLRQCDRLRKGAA